MKNLLSAAVNELNRLELDLKRADSQDAVECLVRLEALGRLLLGRGPVGWATAAAVNASALNESAIHKQAMLRSIAGVKEPTRGLIADVDRSRRLIHEGSPLRLPVEWHDETSDAGKVLAALRDSDGAWNEMRLTELRKLAKSVLPALCECLKASEQALTADEVGRAQLRELHARAHALSAAIHSGFDMASQVVQHANLSDHRNTLAAINELVSAVNKLRARDPEIDLAAFECAAASLSDLLPRCERLVSAVRADLLEGPDRAYAIDRLTLQLERFERVSLLKNMLDAKRPEQILQEAVDRFLFGQGLYPITHASAGQGRLDTLIPEEAWDMRCILLELKQVVRDTTARAVQRAVADALGQAEHYSSGLRSHARWALHDVYCIVAYAGPTRFSMGDDARVKLIYLGEAPPSAGTTPLFSARSKDG